MNDLRSLEDDFEYFVKDPLQWMGKGQTLYWAAKCLFAQHERGWQTSDTIGPQGGSMSMDEGAMMMVNQEMFMPAGMLAGFALEVTIKAIIVAKYPDRIMPKMKSKAWTNGATNSAHDLIALAKAAEIDPIDSELLQILTKFSIWKGRYPSNVEGIAMYGMASEWENFSGTFWREFPLRLEKVYFGLRDNLKVLLPDRFTTA